MEIAAGSRKSPNFLLVVGGIIAIVAIWFAFYLFANQPAQVAVSQAAAVTAQGGKGKAQTYGAEFNFSITAKEEGGQCNYKGFWSDGKQEGSGYFQPCNQQGYENYLRHLLDSKKITPEFYELLKAVKFW